MKVLRKYISFCIGAVAIFTIMLYPTSMPGKVSSWKYGTVYEKTEVIKLQVGFWQSGEIIYPDLDDYADKAPPDAENYILCSANEASFSWRYWIMIDLLPGLLVGITLAKLKYYFTFSGRISLGDYWITGVIPGLVLFVLGVVIDVNVFDKPDIPPATLVIQAIWLIPALSVLSRRCHDRDKSAAFILLLFVPVISIWPAIELAFVEGTQGKNQFDKHSEHPATIDLSKQSKCINEAKQYINIDRGRHDEIVRYNKRRSDNYLLKQLASPSGFRAAYGLTILEAQNRGLDLSNITTKKDPNNLPEL